MHDADAAKNIYLSCDAAQPITNKAALPGTARTLPTLPPSFESARLELLRRRFGRNPMIFRI